MNNITRNWAYLANFGFCLNSGPNYLYTIRKSNYNYFLKSRVGFCFNSQFETRNMFFYSQSKPHRKPPIEKQKQNLGPDMKEKKFNFPWKQEYLVQLIVYLHASTISNKKHKQTSTNLTCEKTQSRLELA